MRTSEPYELERRVAELGRRDLYFASKRVLDIVIAGILLIVLAPLMLLIGLLIRLDSPGPAIFKQTRVNAKRRVSEEEEHWEIGTFTIYKFRSMRHGADSGVHRAFVRAFIRDDRKGMVKVQQDCEELVTGKHPASSEVSNLSGNTGCEDVDGPELQAYKLMRDPRVTRLGRVLRKTSIDELPQLVNVIKGDMSLVGPRPDLPYSVEDYKPWHFERLNAQPGITGLWQVDGRSQVSWDEFVRLDIEYIRNRSLVLDLSILLRTPLAVLKGKGAT